MGAVDHVVNHERIAWLVAPAAALVALVYLVPLGLVLRDSITNDTGHFTLAGKRCIEIVAALGA